MITALEQRPERLPMATACKALGLNRSTVYQWRKSPVRNAAESSLSRKDAPQPRALSPFERDTVRELLLSEPYRDQPPYEVYHALLEQGRYLCSISTMHRLLREDNCSGERRQQRPAQHHAIPRLEATRPNQVWTWDITKLATHQRGVYLCLYVVIDLFSRFVVAWMISRKENSALSQQLMDEAVARYNIGAGELTIHQDRGSPMIAHNYLDLMSELGVTTSHSRPRVSNDNPFSESQFKTAKYQPDYPGRFTDIAHGRQWCESYFDWYNFSHHHSGLAGFTPAQVFTGKHEKIAEVRQQALAEQFTHHPERFVKGPPKVAMPCKSVFINPIQRGGEHEMMTTAVNFPTLSAARESQRNIH